MLIYNPVFDLFHCTFRMLQILEKKKDEIQIEKLRIFDFYLAFPNEIGRIRLPKDIGHLRRNLIGTYNPYEIIIDSTKIFLKMKPYQLSAINFLNSLNLIQSDSLMDNLVKRNDRKLPGVLKEQIELRNKENELVINTITQVLNKISLNGHDGLKARTKLMEYKYDVL
ncbi:MAG: hypothetical protein IPM32_09070 [Ignavibacteriae bacterium]|nr:hypothetical protein [Ignavibacteriota bacterium]